MDYRLYLVTDDPSRYSGDWLDNVVAAVEGGVTCVQYRDTESAADERLVRVRRLQDALKRFGTPLVVNNDAELAAAVKAEGVHVGQSDMPPEQVRVLVGPRCEIGLSITDISQLSQLADNRFVDCIGIGPVFDARKTKPDASAAMGVSGLAEIITATQHCQLPTTNYQLPAVAIGGITLANAAEVLATGVGGLAVVSAFSKSPDPFATAQAFRKLFEAIAKPSGNDSAVGTRTWRFCKDNPASSLLRTKQWTNRPDSSDMSVASPLNAHERNDEGYATGSND